MSDPDAEKIRPEIHEFLAEAVLLGAQDRILDYRAAKEATRCRAANLTARILAELREESA